MKAFKIIICFLSISPILNACKPKQSAANDSAVKEDLNAEPSKAGGPQERDADYLDSVGQPIAKCKLHWVENIVDGKFVISDVKVTNISYVRPEKFAGAEKEILLPYEFPYNPVTGEVESDPQGKAVMTFFGSKKEQKIPSVVVVLAASASEPKVNYTKNVIDYEKRN